MLKLGLSVRTLPNQVARLARDLWIKINDTWNLEERKWENII
tara:strand:+ start:3808 stop:3933 length:126 start_codon:yes stop_codon:yes gene_type:complete